MFEAIPSELKALKQWCLAAPDGSPINPKTGSRAKVNDPATWGTFEEAASFQKPIGFICSKTDPFCIIDLDDKEYDPCPPEEKQIHLKIVDAFASYSEVSRSGRGFHIVVKGTMTAGGRKRGRVEVYSYGRFMILTGNVYRMAPVANRQALLDQLVSEMEPIAEMTELTESEEVLSDAELFDIAISAENGAKFDKLTRGDFSDYPSQSEADLALLAILAFYSQSNEQVRRVFRCSPLGQRDKAVRDNRYLDYAIRKIRGKDAPEVDLSKIEIPKLPEKAPKSSKKSQKQSEAFDPIPPGFAGYITRYFLSTVVRPVPEISLAATIGLLAGITGRAYNISGAGLNQYILLLGKTGVGKEGMQSGIDQLLAGIRLTIPVVDDFIGPAAYASGPAIIKTVAKKPCIVSILGEFGLTLQYLTDPKNSTGAMFKKVLLDIYGKSGANQTLRSSVYSDSDKSTSAVHSPSLTILGESTPETFYEGLSQSHVAEGLVPRFLVIHYTGPRPPRNLAPNQPVPEDLKRQLVEIVAASSSLQSAYQIVDVKTSPEAATLLDALNEEADDAINSAKMDTEAQLWNRAHLKALKLAALLAVANNPHDPQIDADSACWAIQLIRKDLATMTDKFTSGDIGQGDTKQLADLRRSIDNFFSMDEKTLIESYALPQGLRSKGLIPYLFLQRRTANLASYRQDRLGATTALKRSLECLMASGELTELPRSQGQSLGFTGRIFAKPKA